MTGNKFLPSALVTAIRNGSLYAVIGALDDGANIEEADMHGQPGLPLRTACFGGDLAIVGELIRRGANVNAAGKDGPGMPLRLALRGKKVGVVALLLKHGATIPPGIQVPLQMQAEAEKLDLPPLEMEVPELPKSVGTESEFIRIIEETRPEESMGTETNLLAMDLLRFNEDDESAPTPSRQRNTHEDSDEPSAPSGFGKSDNHSQ